MSPYNATVCRLGDFRTHFVRPVKQIWDEIYVLVQHSALINNIHHKFALKNK